MSEDPDAALLARVAAGDEAATRRFVAAKLPRLLGLASRVLRDRAEAEDVAQEALVRAWRQAPRWEPRARVDTWMHTVVLNLCRDRLRRRREVTADAAAAEAIPDPAPDPEASLAEAQLSTRVEAAISELPERQREAVLLVHYQGLSGSDAAAMLGISVEALESLLARGRRTLRARLTKERISD